MKPMEDYQGKQNSYASGTNSAIIGADDWGPTNLVIDKIELKPVSCEGCAYNRRECLVFEERIPNCWNHTTPQEAARREKAIRDYAITYYGKYKPSMITGLLESH